MADNQRRIHSIKGHHSLKTECRVIVLFFCTSSDKLRICTKFHKYTRFFFRDVNHKSTSLMVLKNDTMDTIFKLKNFNRHNSSDEKERKNKTRLYVFFKRRLP